MEELPPLPPPVNPVQDPVPDIGTVLGTVAMLRAEVDNLTALVTQQQGAISSLQNANISPFRRQREKPESGEKQQISRSQLA